MELSRANFFPRLWANENLSMQRLGASASRFAAFLWENIGDGAPDDRGAWTLANWAKHISQPQCQFYALFLDGEPIGCVELQLQPRLMDASKGPVRLTALGIFEEYTGESIGPLVLTRAVEKAFASGATKVVLESGDQLPEPFSTICRHQGFVPAG